MHSRASKSLILSKYISIYETFTRYSKCASDSTIDWKICSVMRGINPFKSGLSMSAPWVAVISIYTYTPHARTYHHCERLSTASLTVRKDRAVVPIEDIYGSKS